MDEKLSYSISILETTGMGLKTKASVHVTDCGPIDLVNSQTHNWRIEMVHPDNGQPLMEIYTSGPIPTDFIDFGGNILQSLHFAREE